MTDPTTLTGQDGAPYLAVDVQPDNLTGAFVLDDSRLGGPDMLLWSDDAPGAWVNIVCDVTRAFYRRGATRLQGILTQAEAGTATITLSDTRHAFDPLANPDVLHKGTPLRLRAWGTDPAGALWEAVLFTGELDEIAVQYLKEDAPVVTLTAVDLVGPLVAWESEGRPDPGVGAGDNLRRRVDRVLAEVGRGTVSPDSDAAFVATLAPSTLARPWQDLTVAVEAELGRLWVDVANRLVLRSRGSELAGPVRGTLSDVHGEAPLGVHCCVRDATVVYGVESMANRAIAARRIPRDPAVPSPPQSALVRRDDELSQARHGVGVVDRRDLELSNDAQLAPWAEAVVVDHSLPELRVDSVTPAPSPDDLDSALAAWPAVLRTDLGDRWLFHYHPTVGPTVERAVGVLGIEVEATPEEWAVHWTTAAAPAPGMANPSGWVTLDVSELDGQDVLAPYAVPR